MKAPVEQKRSIAVLPFVNMSTDPENEFFSDGISEELINALTRVDGLQVTARTSSFAFKGKNKDVRKIGRDLGVSAVLEGSMRKAGNRVRITAQLIDTRDGYHIFSKVYDRVLEDIFKTQDEISLEIANEFRATLPGNGKKASLVVPPTENAEAYDAYLKGLYCWNQWTPDAARQAVDHFQHAVDLDPEFAQAWAAMARSHSFLAAMERLTHCGEAYGCASNAAERAIELNPDIEDSHVALALVRLFHDWDLPGAEASFLRALSINPDSADVLHSYSLYLSAAGRFEDSAAALEKAATLDPLNLPVLDHLGRAYVATERYDEALRELTPHPKGGITPLAVALALVGRNSEAEELLTIIEEREREEDDVALHLDFASIYAAMGRTDEALARLHKAAEMRIGALVFVRHHPSWNLGKIEGISEFLEEIGL
jgi:TolB-like protein